MNLFHKLRSKRNITSLRSISNWLKCEWVRIPPRWWQWQPHVLIGSSSFLGLHENVRGLKAGHLISRWLWEWLRIFSFSSVDSWSVFLILCYSESWDFLPQQELSEPTLQRCYAATPHPRGLATLPGHCQLMGRSSQQLKDPYCVSYFQSGRHPFVTSSHPSESFLSFPLKDIKHLLIKESRFLQKSGKSFDFRQCLHFALQRNPEARNYKEPGYELDKGRGTNTENDTNYNLKQVFSNLQKLLADHVQHFKKKKKRILWKISEHLSQHKSMCCCRLLDKSLNYAARDKWGPRDLN